MTSKPEVMTPRTATTMKRICALPQDGISLAHYWLQLEGERHVTLCEQTPGHPAKAMITMPRRQFEQIVDWYNGVTK